MDAVISVDEQQRIVVFNKAAEFVFQCAASDAVGSTLDQIPCVRCIASTFGGLGARALPLVP
jgi:nitrogen fixation/metabolism regulation signal transduction histidine kinase